MKKRKIKVVEWNLHGMTGYNTKGNLAYHFPSKFIIENIERFMPDIIVFTEFCSFRFGDEWNAPEKDSVLHKKDDTNALQTWFDENGYKLIYSEYNKNNSKSRNDVGIAVKKEFNPTKKEVDFVDAMPDYLGVYCTNPVNEKTFLVAGVRIRPENDKGGTGTRKQQFDYITQEIEQEKTGMPVIAVGDFNNGVKSSTLAYRYSMIEDVCNKKNLYIYTPGVKEDGKQLDYQVFSYVVGDSLCKLDHMITSFDAQIGDLNNKEIIRYDWSFIGDVYNNLKEYNTINESLRNIPDHAIFYVEITLPEN